MKQILDIIAFLVFLSISLAVLTKLYGYNAMIKPIEDLLENNAKYFLLVWLIPPIYYLIFKIKKNDKHNFRRR